MAANKELVRRYIDDVLAAGNLQAVDQLVAADYSDSSPGAIGGHGPEVVRASQTRLRNLFRDIQYHLDQLVAEGD
ncbi:MAG TPA: nuclear transport factor 2 family protein, partial [Thermoanaerobaculia bacterium]|nr:nuclear transport factor 2 family protein [Thermoanaerobaculia bacterium]